MPKRRTKTARGSTRGYPRRQEQAALPNLRTLLALLIIPGIVGLLTWYARPALLHSLGLGALVLVAWLGVFGLALHRWRSSLVSSWNRWLGGLVGSLALIGFFSLWKSTAGPLAPYSQGGGLGGTFGLLLVGKPIWAAILRESVLVALALFIGIPRHSWSLTKWLGRVLRAAGSRLAQAYSRFPLHDLLGTTLKGLGSRIFRRPSTPAPAASSAPFDPSEPPEAALPPSASPEPAGASAPPSPGSRFPWLPSRSAGTKVQAPEEGSPVEVRTSSFRLPNLDILDRVKEAASDEAENLRKAALIEEALREYGIAAEVKEINPGPTVTQFGVEPGWSVKSRDVLEEDEDGNPVVRREPAKVRVKVDRIATLDKDLARALAAPSIRIEAPVPGTNLVGIEVPNDSLGIVSLRSILESPAFEKLRSKTKLAIALGKGAGGEALAADLSKMPHLLIAGATGSGKSVCINAVICCLLMQLSPDDLRLILVDPKRVELSTYAEIPHLMMPPVVETDKVLVALRWLNAEMDRRYKAMQTEGVKNIESYNRKALEHLPYVIVAVDEMADLMMAAPVEIEHLVTRLAQLGRATGIHLIVATQRPSVDVITGLIKANFPTRISFQVSSMVDSRTILDSGGAEKLLGKGDMLYLPPDAPKPKRLQGTYLSDQEISRLADFWRRQKNITPRHAPLLHMEVVAENPPSTPPMLNVKLSQPKDPEEDPEPPSSEATLLEQAKTVARQHKTISSSVLQRKLQIGRPLAEKLLEQLEQEGVVAQEGSDRSRRVLAG